MNSDQAIDLGDVTTTLLWLFTGTIDITCPDAADFDDSGIADVADPIQMLGFLFLGGAAPFPPSLAEPAADPTPDLLPCELYDLAG